jgi:hypothetical protein
MNISGSYIDPLPRAAIERCSSPRGVQKLVLIRSRHFSLGISRILCVYLYICRKKHDHKKQASFIKKGRDVNGVTKIVGSTRTYSSLKKNLLWLNNRRYDERQYLATARRGETVIKPRLPIGSFPLLTALLLLPLLRTSTCEEYRIPPCPGGRANFLGVFRGERYRVTNKMRKITHDTLPTRARVRKTV